MTALADPSAEGRFGEFGGQFVPETLVPACQELEQAFHEAWNDAEFRAELSRLQREYAGRPSILTECHNLGRQPYSGFARTDEARFGSSTSRDDPFSW